MNTKCCKAALVFPLLEMWVWWYPKIWFLVPEQSVRYGVFFCLWPLFLWHTSHIHGTFIQCLVHLEKEVKMFQLFNRLICWRGGLHGCASIINGASCYPLVGVHCQGPQGQRQAWLAMHTETGYCCLTKRVLYRVFYCITMWAIRLRPCPASLAGLHASQKHVTSIRGRPFSSSWIPYWVCLWWGPHKGYSVVGRARGGSLLEDVGFCACLSEIKSVVRILLSGLLLTSHIWPEDRPWIKLQLTLHGKPQCFDSSKI